MNELLSKHELAKLLGISEQTIDRYRKQGMPWKRVGVKLVRFDLDVVNDWLLNKENK